MLKINPKQQIILLILLEKGRSSSSAIHKELGKRGKKASLVTVKRELAKMVAGGLLVIEGLGPATEYLASVAGRVHADIEAKNYCAVEPDQRFSLSRFNFELPPDFPADIFSIDESQALSEATLEYRRRTAKIPAVIQKKELERLVIELAWKSSRIEGNTYTLLETEKLILEHQEAPGHSRAETRMILNHKAAFTFAHEQAGFFKILTRANLDQLHALLVKDLSIGRGFRKKPVGILGSKYRPPDNVHQITDAVAELTELTARQKTP